MQIRDDMVGGNSAFLDGYQEVSSLGAGGGERIDENAGALDCERIGLAGVELKGADQVEVGAEAEIAAIE